MVDPVLRTAMGGCARGQRPWPLFIYGDVGTGKTCGALTFTDYVHGGVVTDRIQTADARELRRAWESGGDAAVRQAKAEGLKYRQRSVSLPSFYTTLSDLLATLIACQKDDVVDDRYADCRRLTPRVFWRRWAEAALCVIDELGQRTTVSDFHYDTLKTAIDRREGKPLVLVSNSDGAGLAEVYDERIASRCVAGTVVRLTGPDRRLIDGQGTGGTTT